MNLVPNIEEKSLETPQDCGVEDYNQVFFDLFCLFVGKKGRRYTPADISAATGISINTIENYTQRLSAPNFSNLMTLCRVMPFEFKSRFISMLSAGTNVVNDIRNDHADILEELASKMRRGEL